ncbi:MAG: Outer rane efflux protein [Nitrosospira multiformis]|jgi:cobalt-zinc-cadmium efflux system outer membrane protein|nr:Outer rane efflux protein [Nitrosospira multiformis]
MYPGVQVDCERVDVLNLLSNVLPVVRIVLGIMLFSSISAMLHAASFTVQPESAKERLSITEQQAIALFYQRNLRLIAASLNIDNAEAQEIIAGAIPNPVFSLTLQELTPKAFARESLNPGEHVVIEGALLLRAEQGSILQKRQDKR